MSLTRSAIRDIIVDGRVLNEPVIQVAEVRQKNNLYKVALSDGSHFTSAVLGSKLKPLVENGTITRNCILKLKKYSLTNNPKQPLVVISVELEKHMNTLIGLPKSIRELQNYKNEPINDPIPRPADFSNAKKVGVQEPQKSPNTSPTAPQTKVMPQKVGICIQSSNFDVTIASLTMYLQGWAIKARIINKSAMREFKGAKPGRLFNIVLKDISNMEIKGTFFNNEADKYYTQIEEGKTYKISGGKVKKSNPRYSTVKNDLEITFDSSTIIDEIPDNGSIPGNTYNFIKLDEINSKENNDVVDICAVVFSIDECTQIMTKKGTQMSKRRIELADMSGIKVDATIWGDVALGFDYQEGDTIIIKDAQVSTFHGKSINIGFGSTICKHVSVPEASKLREWWNSLEDKNIFQSVTSESEFTSGAAGSQQNKLDFLSEIESKGLCKTEQGDVFTVDGIILAPNSSRKPVYLACPNEQCHNCGLQVNEDGKFICKRCGQMIDKPKPRFSLNIKVADFSGSIYTSILGDDSIGTAITGLTAEDLYQASSDEKNLKTLLFKNCYFNDCRLKIKGKQTKYRDSMTTQMIVLSGGRLNYAEACHELFEKIETF